MKSIRHSTKRTEQAFAKPGQNVLSGSLRLRFECRECYCFLLCKEEEKFFDDF